MLRVYIECAHVKVKCQALQYLCKRFGGEACHWMSQPVDKPLISGLAESSS